jgi:hypothetical protein
MESRSFATRSRSRRDGRNNDQPSSERRADSRAAGASVSALPPEMALLLSCVRRALGTDGSTLPGEWNEVDWDRLVTLALGHGVMPHLHAGLEHACANVPMAARDELQRIFRDNARCNLFRAGELRQLLALFDAHGVPTVPLKGPVLAVSLFGSVAMRQFTDLDLLVPMEDAASAGKLLQSRGYDVRSSGETSITAVRDAGLSPLVVDLQWKLAEDRYCFPLDEKQLNGRLVSVDFMNTTVRQPALDDLLIILSAHPAKHCWSKLEWVVDIAAFLGAHGNRIDWRSTLDRAERLGARRLVLLAIGLAEHLLRLDTPAEVRARIRADAVVRRLVAELADNLCNPSSALKRLNGPYGLVEAGLLYMRTRERLADKLPYLRFLARLFREWFTMVPNECDYGVVALPRCLSVLYFAVRPVRLLGKYGGRLVRSGLQAAASLR